MELKEFVTQTLIQIIEGVKDAQEQTKESGALINPKTYRDSGLIIENSKPENKIRNIQNVKMNIAVTVTENTTTSRIEFDVPVSFPVSENNN